jgi:hypothetical protein
LLAGGNQVSPAPFDLKSGKCLAQPFDQGRPKANAGQFVGVFQQKLVIAGGRILYSAPQNVSTKGSFVAVSSKAGYQFNYGGIAPAWNDDHVAFVNYKHGKLICCDAGVVADRIEKGYEPPSRDNRRPRRNSLAANLETDARWQTDLGESNKFEVVSLVVCPNAIITVVQYQQKFRAQPQWYIAGFAAKDGEPLFQHELREEPLPGGLLVDRRGQAVVTMIGGPVICYGG